MFLKKRGLYLERDVPSTPENGPLPPDSDDGFFGGGGVFFCFLDKCLHFLSLVLDPPFQESRAPGPGLSLTPKKASLAHPPPAIDARGPGCPPEGWAGSECSSSESSHRLLELDAGGPTSSWNQRELHQP